MTSLHVYDPPLCCSSGVCGPSVDQELVRVNSDLEWLKTQDIDVQRHNLAQQPLDFTSDPVVKERLQSEGQEGLPFVFLNGKLAAAGFYPTRDQLAELCKVELCEESKGCCG